ncbi:phosphoglyceromutase [Methyloceanibacter marginalis]|uniref:2,3-bisphosphoglycerate-dependent phosphoglycerate mutase n=1 Tax=Methyloceanibacter marginalis TaxID=1774971 RepID=A0A1E3WD61_9HYPH|nr:2,3-bisphosphoglycerate-dependent phosphoglycerate mutase [Methyloceanibacter marginalis]ODS03007.1 phosphoglyceromutase [Methyloceanibacter marginalis]
MLQKTSEKPRKSDNVLVLVRHGQSEWNRLNMFTGWKDVGLSEEGEAEAHRAGLLLKEEGLVFDSAFASTLKRAHNTLDIILGELGQGKLPTVKAAALNERDYGQLVGINKEEARKRFGADQVHVWQRSYDIAPPGGESLKDTAARVCPFFDRWIVPELQAGKNVIVVAHGNSLRSLIMELDKLTPEEVQDYSIATATPVIYRVKADGTLVEKRNLAA